MVRIASIATIPSRQKYLEQTVASLSPQVDEVRVFSGDNELGDANKFRGVQEEGYMFTCDDDIVYPDDYISTMIGKINAYGRKAVITAHGKRIRKHPVRSFYGNSFTKYRCMDEVKKDVLVHIPGTGVMGWHSSTINFPMELFEEPNMADIWAYKRCEEQGVPRICIHHEKGWLKGLDAPGSCYQSNKHRDHLLTAVINSV